jgi:hypothetical protein
MLRSQSPVYGPQFRAESKERVQLDKVPVQEWTWTPADPSAAEFKEEPPTSQDAVATNYRPSKKTQAVVLVFEMGVITVPLIEALKAEGLKYFYVDYREFMEAGTVWLNADPDRRSELSLGPAKLLLSDVAAVVWSAPMLIQIPALREASNTEIFSQRWLQVLRELRQMVPKRTLWLPSHPFNGSNQWQEKLSECLLAEECGLHVPATICTNDRERAATFIKKHEQVVFKEFSHAPNRFKIGLVDVTAPEFAHLDSSPVMLQRCIDKEFEVRAVVIGDRVFACRIDSQASDAAKLDWRVYDNARVRWDRMKLPKAVQKSMLKLMKRLDILWGSFDLIKGADGKFWFLEVNRPGASYWLKPFVGLDVPVEIARFLGRRLTFSSRPST